MSANEVRSSPDARPESEAHSESPATAETPAAGGSQEAREASGNGRVSALEAFPEIFGGRRPSESPRGFLSRFARTESRIGASQAPAAVPVPSAAPTVPDPIEEPEEIRWEGAIFERVTSIESRLDGLDEVIDKRAHEIESRLLHLMDERLRAMETEMNAALSGISEHISREGEKGRFRYGAGIVVLLAVGLMTLARVWF